MTKEEKRILLKDLCARLPYGVIIDTGTKLRSVDILTQIVSGIGTDKKIENIKPYLRPMSSMTEEEKFILQSFVTDVCLDIDKFDEYIYIANPTQLDWLNEHHFDYRGLIPMGLALEAKEDMYKTE